MATKNQKWKDKKYIISLYNKKYAKKNEKLKIYKNLWYKQNRKRMSKKNKEWVSKNRIKSNKIRYKWIKENPIPRLTRNSYNYNINKYCQVGYSDFCKKLAIERHHEDYLKPKEYISCCKPCHYQLDLQRRARENDN